MLVQDSRRAGNSNDFRYISFAHFADEGRTKEEIAILEGVVNIMLNSLSRRPNLIRVEAADPDRTIFRFRISQLGWNAADWDEVVRFYPYCLQSEVAAHQNLYDRLDTEAPYLRGDWFISTATLSPLYERLLDLPANLAELEEDLDFNIDENVREQRHHPHRLRPVGRVVQRAHDRAPRPRQWRLLLVELRLRGPAGDLSGHRAAPGPGRRDWQRVRERLRAGRWRGHLLAAERHAGVLPDRCGRATSSRKRRLHIVADPRRRKGAVQNALSCFGCHTESGMLVPEGVRRRRQVRRRAPQRLQRRRARQPSARSTRATRRPSCSGTRPGSRGPSRPSVARPRAASRAAEWSSGTPGRRWLVSTSRRSVCAVAPPSSASASSRPARSSGASAAAPRTRTLFRCSISDPLVTREEWFCRYREVIGTDVRRERRLLRRQLRGRRTRRLLRPVIND